MFRLPYRLASLFAVVPAFWLLSAAAPSPAQTVPYTVIGENLIENGSFESVDPQSGNPSGWSGSPDVFQADRDVFTSGGTSLRYHNENAEEYHLATQTVPVQPGWKVRFSARVRVENIVGDESGATICLQWNDKQGKWMGGGFPTGVKGTADWTRIEGIARVPSEAGSVSLSCYVRQGMTGSAWFDDVEVVRIADPPMQTVLCEPGYRGWILGPAPPEGRLRIRLNLADYDAQPADCAARLQLTGEDGKTVWENTFSFDSDLLDCPFPTDQPVGRYTLTVDLTGKQGQSLQQAAYELQRRPDDFQPTAWIDAHRRLILDGKPFFPIGMYCGGLREEDLKVIADSPFNCLMPYGSPDEEQMDMAHRHGLKIIYSVKDFYAGSQWCPPFIRTEADEEPAVLERVRRFREHPALLAWYLNDELPQSYLPRLEAHQRWVAEGDQNHPTWVVLYQVDEVRHYIRTFDVIGTDPYPIGHAPASMAGRWTAETAEQTEHARPLWQVPQLHNWINYHEGLSPEATKDYHTPTYDEMHSMTWQCICEGSKGLIYYCWHDMHRNPDVPFETQWDQLKRIAAEVERFSPVLLSDEPAPVVPVAAAGEDQPPEWLCGLVRRQEGWTYLFLVNNGDGEGDVNVRVSQGVEQVEELTESGELTVRDGSLTLGLPKYRLRVLRFR